MTGERERLESHGIRPRKRFGQNFLTEPRIPELIVERASWEPGEPVFEVGPGGGALTEALLTAGHSVIAVEKDTDLVAVLEDRFSEQISSGRFRCKAGDALDVTLEDLKAELPDGVEMPRWVAGNLPYPITTSLLLWALQKHDALSGAVFMVQREYAERLAAKVGTKTYGSITVWTRAHATVRSILKVGRSSFWPRPGVESSVVELQFPDPPPYKGDFATFERVLRAAFGQRRKTLLNSLSSGLSLDKTSTEAVIRLAGIDPGARAETLDVDQFGAIVEALGKR